MPVYLKTWGLLISMEKKIAIVTCCLEDWGGSEELWARAVPYLLAGGITQITVYKNKIDPRHHEFASLLEKKIQLKELSPKIKPIKRAYLKVFDAVQKIADKLGVAAYQWNRPAYRLFKQLKKNQPDLVIVSQGINFDGLVFANQCLQLDIPYLIICHKAVNFFWPAESDRNYMRETLLKAEQCLFVSKHNKELTEEQFGIRLKNSAIIVNPVKTKVNPLPYPSVEQGFKLACIGRLFVIDKGQDMVLRILQQDKWKNRNISVSFIGKGPDKEALMDMAKLLSVKNVSFGGYQEGLATIWQEHHALIIPSRSEGLPLTIIEAMSLGRMVIATNAGGNAEVLQEGVTGFIGEANEKDLESALERAWAKHDEWERMGIAAARHMTKILPENPSAIFSNLVMDLVDRNFRK